MNFSKTLKKLRKQQKISQEKLANILQVSRSTVAMWENNSNEPDINTLIKIANLFNTTLDELVSNETLPKNSKETSIIRTLRKEKGLSQAELAKLIPVNQTAISQWERGITYPSSNAIKRLCEIFEKPSNIFLGIQEKNESNNDKYLNKHAKNLIDAYHAKPEMQNAINKLLDITNNNKKG